MPTRIVVPELGESVVSARVARWLKKDGETVAAGEPLVELETEKIDLEVGAEAAGVLAIAKPAGAEVRPGDVLGTIAEAAAPASPAAGDGRPGRQARRDEACGPRPPRRPQGRLRWRSREPRKRRRTLPRPSPPLLPRRPPRAPPPTPAARSACACPSAG